MDVTNEIRAELDRVGVSYAKAGAADYVQARDEGDDLLALIGPPRPPRKMWRGPASDALRLLELLEDRAGVDAFWSVFSPDTCNQ